jgi:hypothetical protein
MWQNHREIGSFPSDLGCQTAEGDGYWMDGCGHLSITATLSQKVNDNVRHTYVISM